VTNHADLSGSHAANQSKTESMPPTEGHADPDAAPEPTTVVTPGADAMTVGAADPQAPSPDALRDRDRGSGATGGPGEAGGVPVTSGHPAPGTSEDLPRVQGIHVPR
jgi:hypothetical protein